MHFSLLALVACASSSLAALKPDVEAQVVLGSGEAGSSDLPAFDRPSLAAVGPTKYDFGLIAGAGWSINDERKQFIAVVASDTQAMVKYYQTSAGWSDGWQKIGGSFPNRTLSVHQFGDTVYISGVNARGALLLKYFRGGRFYPSASSWIYLDDQKMGTPSMANIDEKTLNILVRATETKKLWVYSFDIATEEQSSSEIGGSQGVANPTLVSYSPGVLCLFQYVGDDHTLVYSCIDTDDLWSSMYTLSSYFGIGSPKAIARNDRIDIIAVGQSKRVFLISYNGTKWISERNAGTDAVSSATLMYWKNQVLGYYHDSRSVKSVTWTDTSTTDPADRNGQLWSPPVAFTWDEKSRIDLWGVGDNGVVYQKRWDIDDDWGSWQDRGGSAYV